MTRNSRVMAWYYYIFLQILNDDRLTNQIIFQRLTYKNKMNLKNINKKDIDKYNNYELYFDKNIF